MSRLTICAAALCAAAMLSACTTVAPTQNTAGRATIELNPNTRGPVAGVGFEGQDLIALSDQMVRDLLSNPRLANSSNPPQIIMDGEYIANASAQRIDRNLIANRMRAELNRASQGRMIFVSRESAEMVARERELKRQGVVDAGALGLTQAQAGGDYRLRGEIGSMDSRDPRSGLVQRLTQITFEMIDLERGTIIWSGPPYTISRAAADDIVYR
jgi:penicillin-binding protein activator